MSALTPPEPYFIANNLALDFTNTAFGIGEGHLDLLTDDRSVLDWLKQAGELSEDFHKAPEGLAVLAKELREAIGGLIRAAMAGRRGDPSIVNRILESGQPVRRLEWDAAGERLLLVEGRRDDSSSSLLEPVAASVASLFSEGHLQGVRECEAHDCALLFKDSTKSHRRRWCSMAVCGNRMKVAAFRSRKTSG